MIRRVVFFALQRHKAVLLHQPHQELGKICRPQVPRRSVATEGVDEQIGGSFYSTNDRGDNVPFSSSVCLLARHGVVEVGQSEAILVFRTRLSTCKQIVLLVEPEPQHSFTLEVICHLPEVVQHPANLLGIGRFCTGRGNSAGSPRPPYVPKGSGGGFPRSRMSLKIGHVTISR